MRKLLLFGAAALVGLAVAGPTASGQSEPVTCFNLATFEPGQPPELLEATIVGTASRASAGTTRSRDSATTT